MTEDEFLPNLEPWHRANPAPDRMPYWFEQEPPHWSPLSVTDWWRSNQ